MKDGRRVHTEGVPKPGGQSPPCSRRTQPQGLESQHSAREAFGRQWAWSPASRGLPSYWSLVSSSSDQTMSVFGRCTSPSGQAGMPSLPL